MALFFHNKFFVLNPHSRLAVTGIQIIHASRHRVSRDCVHPPLVSSGVKGLFFSNCLWIYLLPIQRGQKLNNQIYI